MTVDTLTVVRRLEAAGTPRPQAEAMADVLRDAQTQSLADLATKTDLALVRADLAHLEQRQEARFEQIEERFEARFTQIDGKFSQLDGKFVQLEQRMTIKLGAMMAVAVGAVAALVRLL